jgi:DNA-binding PadR family transcriptional regulator
MSINRFSFQDDILRELAKGEATGAAISNRIAGEGHGPGHGQNSPELHREVAENIDHLVNLELAEYTADTPRMAQLTQAGQAAAASLPLDADHAGVMGRTHRPRQPRRAP